MPPTYLKPKPTELSVVAAQFAAAAEKQRETAYRERLPEYRLLVNKAADGSMLSDAELSQLDSVATAMSLTRKDIDADVAVLVELAGLQGACVDVDERIRAAHAEMVAETSLIQDLPRQMQAAKGRHATAEGRFMHLVRQRQRRDQIVTGCPRLFDRPVAEVEPAKAKRRKVG